MRGSIYWVLLFQGRFFATKPLSQIQRSTLWPLQDANQTPSLGGFGLRHLTFQLVPSQLEVIEEAIELAVVGTTGEGSNPNKRGNALYALCRQYLVVSQTNE